MSNLPISVYVHWPYCLSLCPYCDFNSHLLTELDQEKWLRAYRAELNFFQEKLAGRYVKSIFFGGGTPSLMPASLVEKLINQLAKIAQLDQDTEITLEANPTSFEKAKFCQFKLAGINRVSIGMQSLQDSSLRLLGRQHNAKEAKDSIAEAAKLFSRYSFDIIYALPGQSLADWQQELAQIMQIAGGHLSLYQLTIEAGTKFHKLFKAGQINLPASEIAADMYEYTNQYLSQFDYNQYEISNYSYLGQECRHNLAYWHYNEYIGIGPGAHSRLHNKIKQKGQPEIEALMMLHKPEKWLESVLENGHGLQQRRNLSKLELIEEIIMMGTRLARGVSIKDLETISGISFENIINQENFAHYLINGLAFKDKDYFGFTKEGLILQNYLLARLIKDNIKY